MWKPTSSFLFPTLGATRIVWAPTRVCGGWEVADLRLPLNWIRASDSERDLTIERLTSAFVEGRLDREEHDHRVGLALHAELYGELCSLTADLPSSGVIVSPPRVRSERWRPDPGPASWPVPWEDLNEEWRWWSGVAVVLTGIWAVACIMSGVLVPYWPLVPLGIWGSVLLASLIWPSETDPP